MDRSIELRCVDSDENKSLESTHIRIRICMPNSSEYAWATHFASSMASSAANISAAGSELTGLFDLCESHDVR